MAKYLAADGLPLRVGDIVTRVDDDIDREYYAAALISGVVVGDCTRGFDDNEITGVKVEFRETENPEYLDTVRGCLFEHVVHLDTTLTTFDEGQFLAMLGV